MEKNQINIKEHRQLFASLSKKAYFNFGGQGLLPEKALDAIIDSYRYIQEHGPFSLRVNNWLQKKNSLLRSTLAEELHVGQASLTLTNNVTEGCNIILWGIDWQAGDHILLSDCEHPGIIAIVNEISRRYQVIIDYVPLQKTLNEGDPLELIALHLKPQTRLLVLSHILWNTGQLMPLAKIVELCHSFKPRSIQVLVDAAQSVGVLPLNLAEMNVDFYAFTGHKWLCGPAGVGGLYISPEAFSSISPTFTGWRGIYEDSDNEVFHLKKDGQRFEVATSAYPQYEGLRIAVNIHQQWSDAQTRYAQICFLSGYLWQSLANLTQVECLKKTAPEAGLVSFQVRGDIPHAKIVQILEEKGLFLRTIKDPHCIRACVHYMTLPSEIDYLVNLIREIVN
jgi:L-cysteine/cystine lyase